MLYSIIAERNCFYMVYSDASDAKDVAHVFIQNVRGGRTNACILRSGCSAFKFRS